MTLSEVASAAALARPTARRLLITLEQLGYVHADQGRFRLTPRVLELGMAYIGAARVWDLTGPHLRALVAQTGSPARSPSWTGRTSFTWRGWRCPGW